MRPGKHSLTVETNIEEGVGKVVTEPTTFTLEASVSIETDNLPKSFDLRVNKTAPPVLYPIKLRNGLQAKSVALRIDDTSSECPLNTEDGQVWKFQPSETGAGSHDVSVLVTTTDGKVFASDVKSVEVLRDLKAEYGEWMQKWDSATNKIYLIMKESSRLMKSEHNTDASIEYRKSLCLALLKHNNELRFMPLPKFLAREDASTLRKAIGLWADSGEQNGIADGFYIEADEMLLPFGGDLDGIYNSGLPTAQRQAILDMRKLKLLTGTMHNKESVRLLDDSGSLFARLARRIDYEVSNPKK